MMTTNKGFQKLQEYQQICVINAAIDNAGKTKSVETYLHTASEIYDLVVVGFNTSMIKFFFTL